jgi:hypothetical protein
LHCSMFAGQNRSYLFNEKNFKKFSLKVRAHFVKLSKWCFFFTELLKCLGHLRHLTWAIS